ncbi:MAG: hypothetical protein PHR26_00205 [Candidatus ainarchaeum sp.]|nr:hypothetical protein [Candidatus ainarchaeum sp.]MDD3975637.1 hypothetical protein [Candidatus ainarchaeum sp.]
MNIYLSKIYFSLFFLILIIGLYSVSAASLGNYSIDVSIYSPKEAHIVETWNIDYLSYYPKDLELFKENVLNANLNLEQLLKIDPNLKPHIYITDFSNLSIGFDEFNNTIRVEYDSYDSFLIKLYENDEEYLWKFNNNLLNYFIINDLYYIPKDSSINLHFYNPLVIQPTIPDTPINEYSISFSGISSNEISILAYERKPPKPSFVVSNFFSKNLGFYLIFIFLIIILILVFKDPIQRSIKSFVIKHSEIKSDKKKFDFMDDDF